MKAVAACEAWQHVVKATQRAARAEERTHRGTEEAPSWSKLRNLSTRAEARFCESPVFFLLPSSFFLLSPEFCLLSSHPYRPLDATGITAPKPPALLRRSLKVVSARYQT